ncbi:MAG: hypothetical protein ACLT5H_09455 [Collinsella stercoris]|uniref:hypothetical protein n=1 Tax=Collinsella stercoris TaxID=147206 RepID=UPI00399631FA
MLPAGSVDAVFVADVDVDNFARGGRLRPRRQARSRNGGAERLRDLSTALAAARSRAVRPTHDRRAGPLFRSDVDGAHRRRPRGGRVVTSVGEGDIAADLDTAAAWA